MATIEERIANVLRTAKDTLSRSEMTEDNYVSFIEELLVKQGLVMNTRKNIENSELPYEERQEESDLVWNLRYDITEKLDVKKSYGVQTEYVYLKNTTLSDDAKKDINAFDKIYEKLKERLAHQVRDKTFTEQEYNKIVNEVGEPIFAEYNLDVPEARRNHILAMNGATIRYDRSLGFNINIVSAHRNEEKRYKRNGLTKKQMTDLIRKSEV